LGEKRTSAGVHHASLQFRNLMIEQWLGRAWKPQMGYDSASYSRTRSVPAPY
jgi:hypothetical protein